MIKAFLESLEDPRRPLVAPNYWILSRVGFILPKNTIAKKLYIIMHEIVTFFVVTQYMELYVIRSNLDLVLTNLKISMLSVVCIFKVNSFVFWQKQWKDLFRYVTEADKFERSNEDAPRSAIISRYTKYCRRLTYLYWALVFLTFVTTELQPLMRYLTSATFRVGVHNGTEGFPHIFSSWMPFDKELAPGCWLTVCWHTMVCAYGAAVMAAYDTSVVVIMVFFGGKLDLLRVRCRQMIPPARAPFTKDRTEAAVKELHQIHVQLIKHSRLFNSVLSPVMFLYVVMCSLMLCASAFQLTSAPNAAQKLIMAEYLIFGIAQLFLFCWHSNDVLIKSENVSIGPYESAWWDAGAGAGAAAGAGAGAGARRDTLLLAGQLRLTTHFSAGPFVDLTLSTFIAILKGAYSYYTLLRK